MFNAFIEITLDFIFGKFIFNNHFCIQLRQQDAVSFLSTIWTCLMTIMNETRISTHTVVWFSAQEI